MKKILIINAGSSTIKWTIFAEKTLEKYASGIADRIFLDGFIETKFNGETFYREIKLPNHKKASEEIVNDLKKYKIIENISEISIIGNRVVQGGTIFKTPVIINKKRLKDISDLSKLAPLHNPGAVQAIKAFKQIFPKAVFTASFDTAFHSTIPEIHYTYPIERNLVKKLQIRKYGMHGLSHKFVTKKLAKILKKKKVSLVNLHIGNGVSLTAVHENKSIDNSMGLTPLAGVMMGTRSGDIDPSIHSYVCREANMTIEQFEQILNKESGMKGVSGISQDLRDVEAKFLKGDKKAIFAINLYCQKLANYLADYINKIGIKKIDAIVFTAGIGENSQIIRKMVINKMKVVDLSIMESENRKPIKSWAKISKKTSQIPIFVIRTNEELMIANEALELVK